MGYSNIENKNIDEILISEEKLKILLDTNVLVAYLDKNHKFNFVATTIIDPLKDKNCFFFFSYIAIGEFIKVWMDLKKVSVTKAIGEIANFANKSLKFSFSGGVPLTVENIFSRFKKHAKHKNFLKAHFNDFLILTEAEGIKNVKVITCDKEMFEAGKSIFKRDIYYIPFNTRKGKSDLSRFINDIGKIGI